MKEVKVLGTVCAKCTHLMEQTQLAAKELGIECSIEKIEDIQKIVGFGVMMTPALVVDGQVKMTGKVPSLDELKKLLA